MPDQIHEKAGNGAQQSKEEAQREANALMERLRHETQLLARQVGVVIKRPPVGAAVAGAAVLAAGALWGATEAALAVVASYVVFRMLTRRRGVEPERREESPA